MDTHAAEPQPPFRRDWLGHGIQTVATLVVVVLALLAWGSEIQSEVALQTTRIAELRTRVAIIEEERASESQARRIIQAALALKLDAMSGTLSTITAQLDDLRKELKR